MTLYLQRVSLVRIQFSFNPNYRYGGVDMIDHEKLYGLLPNYIPDYCLQPNNDESASHHWHSLIVQAYQKVSVIAKFQFQESHKHF